MRGRTSFSRTGEAETLSTLLYARRTGFSVSGTSRSRQLIRRKDTLSRLSQGRESFVRLSVGVNGPAPNRRAIGWSVLDSRTSRRVGAVASQSPLDGRGSPSTASPEGLGLRIPRDPLYIGARVQ